MRITSVVFSTLIITAIGSQAGYASGVAGSGGVPVVIPVEIPLGAPAEIIEPVETVEVGAEVTVPNTIIRKAEADTGPTDKNGNPLFSVAEADAAAELEAAVEESVAAGDAAFKAVVAAMKPRAPVGPLTSKRVNLYISEKVLSAKYERPADMLKVKNGRVHAAGIYSETRDLVVHGGLAVDSDLTQAVRLSFGTRAYIALLEAENDDVFATALGLEAAYNLPFQKLPLELAASFYYAPDILTFGAADRAVDAQVDVAFPLRPNSALFAGARYLQADTTPEDREVDNRLHMGIRWDFM